MIPEKSLRVCGHRFVHRAVTSEQGTETHVTKYEGRMRRGKFKAGPSHIYQRLLRGEVTSERYIAVVKRAIDMRMRRG